MAHFNIPGIATALTGVCFIMGATTGAFACDSIAERGEISDLSVGEVVYADLGGKFRVRIKSIDEATAEICSKKRCYDAGDLYSSGAIADCSEDTLASTGAIYSYGDDGAAPEADKPSTDEESDSAANNGSPIDD